MLEASTLMMHEFREGQMRRIIVATCPQNKKQSQSNLGRRS